MLVLSRKVDESVDIGNGIRVKVVRISNGRVRLGIEAPQGLAISRSEAPKVPRPESADQ